jgi:peptidoglycan/LPS O-acetylase OafA/YrhL
MDVSSDPIATSSARYQSLDVWRGLACLMVVLDHAGIPAFGYHEVEAGATVLEQGLRWTIVHGTRLALGPPLFFVMSGYCIAASIDSVRRKGKPAGHFLIKRLWRTFPPYWIALLGSALLVTGLDALGRGQLYQGPYSYHLLNPSQLSFSQWLGNLSLTETWRPRVLGGEAMLLSDPSWSLCYQEQFYAVCFLAVLLAPRRLYGVLAAATAVFVLLRVVAYDVGASQRIQGLFPVFWQEFAVGLAVYWRLNAARSRRSRWGVDLGLVALFLSVGLRVFPYSTAVAAGFGLALIVLRRWDAQIGAAPALSWLRACGRRCYSIYLVHLPVMIVASTTLSNQGITSFWARALILIPTVMLIAMAAGWTFFHLVESRFLEPPSRPQAKLTRPKPMLPSDPRPVPAVA